MKSHSPKFLIPNIADLIFVETQENIFERGGWEQVARSYLVWKWGPGVESLVIFQEYT